MGFLILCLFLLSKIKMRKKMSVLISEKQQFSCLMLLWLFSIFLWNKFYFVRVQNHLFHFISMFNFQFIFNYLRKRNSFHSFQKNTASTDDTLEKSNEKKRIEINHSVDIGETRQKQNLCDSIRSE